MGLSLSPVLAHIGWCWVSTVGSNQQTCTAVHISALQYKYINIELRKSEYTSKHEYKKNRRKQSPDLLSSWPGHHCTSITQKYIKRDLYKQQTYTNKKYSNNNPMKKMVLHTFTPAHCSQLCPEWTGVRFLCALCCVPNQPTQPPCPWFEFGLVLESFFVFLSDPSPIIGSACH